MVWQFMVRVPMTDAYSTHGKVSILRDKVKYYRQVVGLSHRGYIRSVGGHNEKEEERK